MFYANLLALLPASAAGGFVSAERQGRRTDAVSYAAYLKKVQVSTYSNTLRASEQQGGWGCGDTGPISQRVRRYIPLILGSGPEGAVQWGYWRKQRGMTRSWSLSDRNMRAAHAAVLPPHTARAHTRYARVWLIGPPSASTNRLCRLHDGTIYGRQRNAGVFRDVMFLLYYNTAALVTLVASTAVRCTS